MPTTPFFDQQFVGSVPTPRPIPNDGDSLTYRLSDADLSLSHGKAVMRVAVSYTFHDGIGTAEVVYCYPVGTLILVARDRVLPVQFLRAGMSFLLADGTPAQVTKVDAPEVFPPPSGEKDRHGSQLRRVLGTVKYTGNYPHIDIHFDDDIIGTTPGHRFWCVRRKEWVRACDFKAGDLMRSHKNHPIRVRKVSAVYWANESLYNVEIEDFHNYFVGNLNGDSVWSHNGLGGGGCRVPKAAVVEAIQDGSIRPTTKYRAGVSKPPDHHIFPQEQREWFSQRGIDIDQYVVRLNEGVHTALHYKMPGEVGGGFWNREMSRRLAARTIELGVDLNRRDILRIGAQMRREYIGSVKLVRE